ncbi:uncharacterized protein NECHADRAFT_43023 [Fusarium vanettenii 77-13-4]|uniref:AB hydrolase-1 domain-containing protein n=1 Tax=Fusarium vanettenii (strain ATCC MYA-4622 / CBS 123669 / FGSC 9596 / NRRL 45880 / 77-13-4) TaxID=660122 RepID=C7Z987_FUSV7|nr:uncharacterized protein NECHADRAFT_43023 [Fusarium vanettenii 77-13-4]EEU39014.1 hypothetical protein NECHADRAFT_43023 [Fusarium vanettenii 77-13-4]
MGSVSDKPVFLVVTGAWHPPVCYDSLKNELNRLDYECTIPQMPSMGHETHGVTWEADKAKVLETAEPYFEEGRELVLVGHSYGGIPATVATEGQGVHERAERGLKGGFRCIVFLAAFAVPVKGWDLLTTLGGVWPDWQNTQEAYTKASIHNLSTINEKGFQMLYNDTTEEEARKVYANVLPHSQDAFETGIDFIAADITIPKTYIICENDLIFPLTLQEKLVKLTPGVKERRIAAGHSPFLGKAPETCKILVEIAEGQ